MVIFGKKAKALIKRIEELERHEKLQTEETNAICEKVDKLESALKELTLTVENVTDNDEPRLSPQQIMREWFLGADKGNGGK